MSRVVHVATFVRSGGGMQSLVRRHRVRDGVLGFTPEVGAIFEPRAPGYADVGLSAAWWWTPGKLRTHFIQKIHPRTQGALVVYHEGWALPLLAPGDGALRRIAYLHTHWPGLALSVPALAPWCDAILCVNEGLAAEVRRLAPGFPAERVAVAACPIEPPANFFSWRGPEKNTDRPVQIGLIGRLERALKRADRLPELVRQLSACGVRAEWHVIGDGPLRARLEREVRGLSSVQFHGWLSGESYWRALATLDVAVILSDHETGPIALLEAMAGGALPLYPGMGGLGEPAARKVDARCVYPPGDLLAAARQLAALLAEKNLSSLRPRAQAAIAIHTAEAYQADYATVLRATLARPRISLDTPDRRAAWSDALPMAAVRRVYENALWR